MLKIIPLEFLERLDKLSKDELVSVLGNNPTMKLNHAIYRRQSFADLWRARKG